MEQKKELLLENSGQHRNYTAELAEIIRSPISPPALRKKLANYHENDLAAVLELLSPEQRERLYHILDPETLSDVLEYAPLDSPYFGELSIRKKLEVLSHMEPDRAVDHLRQLNKEQRNLLLELMDESTRRDITLLRSFDEDEAGSIMTTNFIRITAGASVCQAMGQLIAQAAEHDNISTLYVVEEGEIFYGAIDLKDLIIARENTPLENIITTSYPYVYAQEQLEDCMERIKDYSEDSIPVLDSDNRLLGVITAQDFIQVVDDEMGEDYARLAGLLAEEDLREPVAKSIRKRLPWLIILLGLGMVVSTAVGLFEGVVAQLTLVVCFQSLVLDMAGNVGTQSLAVTIRVLTDERLTGSQKLSLIFKEGRVGLLNGIILGVIAFAAIGFYVWIWKGKSLLFSFSISACIGGALLLSMMLSSVAGTVVPLCFQKMKIDPAVASGPLITTVNDLVAVVSYYGLTWLVLLQLMHLTE